MASTIRPQQHDPRCDVRGRRVTIMGLGRHGGGVGVARYLAEAGARVTISDRAQSVDLADSLATLKGVPIERYAWGEHDENDFVSADWLVVNPAVPPHDRFVRLARQAGVRITSEMELFLSACPAQVVGVTGSNGKSTTASMISAILTAPQRRHWLGGNIGRSLLNELDRMESTDVVVLELSSFQLARWGRDVRAIDVAVITNCAPNHLDWHGQWQHYVEAKQQLLRRQSAHGIAVLNDADREVATWNGLVRGLQIPLLEDSIIPPLSVPGKHNRQNAACAGAAARAFGVPEHDIRVGLAAFSGLPHRLQRVGECHGRMFYNDSLATTPESACAALAAFDRPTWMLVGGYDKGCDVGELVEQLARRARGVACYGATGPMIAERLAATTPTVEIVQTPDLPSALSWCYERSQAGDVIVLSPGFASFDQYRDYAERGEHFTTLVGAIQAGRRLARV